MGSVRRRRSAGFPLATLLRPSPARAAGFASAGWRVSVASATWSPPGSGCGLRRCRAFLVGRQKPEPTRMVLGPMNLIARYSNPGSQIVVGEAAAVAVGLEPMVEVDLIQIGGDNFLAQFVRFNAEKRYAESCQCRN